MKKLLAIVAAVVLLIVLVGFLLPGSYRVERSRVVAAERTAVFAVVADLATWPEWTAWSRAEDPECEWTFDRVDEQGRAREMRWSGPRHGDGEMEWTAVAAPERLDYELVFVSGDTRMPSSGSIVLEPAEGGTRVVWSMEGELTRNPAQRWVGLFMDRLIGSDFDEGLDGLEARFEG